MKTLKQIIKRMQEIASEVEEIEKKEILTAADERKFDSLAAEFKELQEKREAITKREDSLKAIKDFGNSPINDPVKPADMGPSANEEIRIFNKSNLNEFRNQVMAKSTVFEEKPLSFGKTIRGLITGDWKDSEAEKRTLGTASSGGGYFIPDMVSANVITMALNKSRIMEAGAYVTPMDNKTLTIPRIASMPVTEWKAENAAFTGNTDMNFEGIQLSARTVVAIIKMSYELAADSLNAVETIENAIAQSIGLAMDLAALSGAGGTEPTGILNTSDILEEDLASSAISNYNFLSSAYYKLQAENEIATALIAPSAMFADLDLLKDKNNNPLQPPLSYANYMKLSSNQLTNNAVMGDFKHLIIGIRNQIQIDIANTNGLDAAFKNLQVWIRAFVRMDVGIKRPAGFCNIKNYGEVSS